MPRERDSEHAIALALQLLAEALEVARVPIRAMDQEAAVGAIGEGRKKPGSAS
jgi:hypothetical protein